MYDNDDDDDMVPASPLDTFIAEGWIDEALHEVKSGKEATVYCCRGGGAAGGGLVAAKVYRARQRRGFKNDAVYHEGRVIGDRRARRAAARKTAFGRETQFAAWIEHEFATLSLLHAAGAAVPEPLTRSSNAILMGYVGDAYDPAPLLSAVSPTPDEARRLLHTLMREVELWLAHDVIHGDLSPYNILWWRGSATVIDFPQAVDPRVNANAQALLSRDIENVCRYVARHGVRADHHRIADNLWRRFLRAEL